MSLQDLEKDPRFLPKFVDLDQGLFVLRRPLSLAFYVSSTPPHSLGDLLPHTITSLKSHLSRTRSFRIFLPA